MELAPVMKTLQVRLGPADAFDLFTRQMARWWPLARFSCGGAADAGIEIEPRVGGNIVEHTRDGARHVWGTLTAWEPPHRFAMTWHPGQPPETATRLAVEFTPLAAGGTEVRLVHDGWRDAERRGGYQQGWDEVLACFVARTQEEQ